MEKKLSRRDFMKGAVAGAVSAGILGLTGRGSVGEAAEAGTAGAADAYLPGTYTSTQKTGFATVEVQGTFSEEALTALTYSVTETTDNDYFQQYGAEAAKLCEDIVSAQSVEVDGISGASLCSDAIRKGAEDCMNQAKGLAAPVPQVIEKIVYADDNAWLGEAPETPDSFAEELEADVAVLGLGYAGIAATRMAAEEGASVVVFEKGSDIGLSSKEMAAIGSKKWAELWPEEEKYYSLKSFLVAEICRMCLDRNRYEVLSSWVNENGEAVDWWLDAVPEDQVSWGTQENENATDPDAPYSISNGTYPYNFEFDPTKEAFPCVPGTLKMTPKGAWQQANLEKARTAAGENLKIYHQTAGYKLLREENGRVSGVIGKKANGEFVKVSVKKGVVLATGGFMNHEGMLRHFLPEVVASGYNMEKNWYSVMDAEGNPCNTGDGHRMGMWVGAKMQAYAASMSHLVAVNGTTGTMPMLWLNKKGIRFMNEDAQGQQFAESVRQQADQVAYEFVDGTYDDHLPDMPVGHGKESGNGLAVIDEKVDGETVFKGETLEELLAQIDIDADAALNSIAHYNELCGEGADSDFGKNPKYMLALEQGPFYAIKYGRGDDLVTMSGLESDGSCHVLDEELNVIPGLYVAGNVQGGRFANIYPETMQGLSVALAMTMGRVAGRNVARE